MILSRLALIWCCLSIAHGPGLQRGARRGVSLLQWVAAVVAIVGALFSPLAARGQAGQWVWVGGSNLANNQAGVYGKQGAAAADTLPGSRFGGGSATDGSGNFWMFGGISMVGSVTTTYFNDLWEFSPATKEWTWHGGGDATAGIYGPVGVASSGSYPGSRYHPALWTDHSGNIWLFGGFGADSTGRSGALNDLWKFDVKTEEWAWIGGSNTLPPQDPFSASNDFCQAGVYGQQGTASASNVPGGRIGPVAWLGSDGKLWLLGGLGCDASQNYGNLNDLWSYDLSSGSWAWVSGENAVNSSGNYGELGTSAASNSPPARAEAANMGTDSGGHFWLFGGPNPLNDLWEYSPATNQWTWQSGSTLQMTTSYGTDQPGVYGTRGQYATGNVPGGRYDSAGFIDGHDILWLFGGGSINASGATNGFNDLWAFDPKLKQWAWMSGSSELVCLSTTNGSCVAYGAPASYGSLGVPSASNVPGSRYQAANWTDKSGNLWIFGGSGVDSAGTIGVLGDLWEFANPAATTPTVPVFGTMTFSPEATEPVGTAQTITISDTLSYTGAQPTGAVSYVLNGVTYTASCTTAGSPETCTAQVPAATIAALAVGPYTVTGSFAGDSVYAPATAASGTFTVTAAGACTIPNSPNGSMNITYYTLAESDRDGNNLPNGLSSNYVLSTLGANGLPVYNQNATAVYGNVSAPRDLLADDEISWWSPALNNGGTGGTSDVVETGTGVVQLPFSNDTFFPPNGTGADDSNGFQTAVLTGTLVAAGSESVGFTIASDDMAFVYLDGQIACDDGGVHGSTPGVCTTSTIAAGTHTLEVFYADLNAQRAALDFSLTTSNAAVGAGNQLVFGTMTFSPAASEVLGTSQTITISDTLTYSGPVPTGAVAFTLNGVSYPATCATTGSPETCVAQVPAATIAALSAGAYPVSGSFAGDCNYSKAAATNGTFTITAGPTKTTLAASATSLTFGQQLVLTATVSSAAGGAVTGTVTFLNGAATLGTAPLNAMGVATLTLTPAVGVYTATASYGGSADGLPSSSSPPIVITVTPGPTVVTLTSSLNPAPGGQPVTFDIVVQAGGATPTGPVTLSDAGTLLATLLLGANGTASFTTSSLSVGSHPLTASYVANVGFTAGQAMLTQVIVPPPDFSISTDGPLTLETQHHGPVTVSVTPINGFSGDVVLSCGTLPPYARCEWGKPTATQTSISVAGSAASTQLIVDTSAVINYLASSGSSRDLRGRFALAGLTFPALFLLFRIRRAKTAARLLLGVFVLGSLMQLSGCSSRYPDSTPPGTYSIEIMGSSGNIQHSAVLTLVVTR